MNTIRQKQSDIHKFREKVVYDYLLLNATGQETSILLLSLFY
jgi:hypothetical protein